MSNKAKLFKSSMNGFKKEDVNKYIIDLNNEFAAKEEDYKNEIKRLNLMLDVAERRFAATEAKLLDAEVKVGTIQELEKSLKIWEENLLEYKSKYEELESNYNELNDSYSAVGTKYAELENELSVSRVKVASLEEANTVLTARCTELEAELQAKNENPVNEEIVDSCESICKTETDIPVDDADISIAEKAKLYDKLTAQVGEIIINANKSADEIIRSAELSAAKLTEGSTKLALESHDKLKGLTDSTVASIKKDLYTGVEACIKEFKSYSEDVSGVSRSMISDLERKYTTLSARIEYLGNTIEKRMSGKLRDFNGKCNAISNEAKKAPPINYLRGRSTERR